MDAEQLVTFHAPPFENAPPARVGGHFEGGGAYYSDDTNFDSWASEALSESMIKCRTATSTRDVVYAYPLTQR